MDDQNDLTTDETTTEEPNSFSQFFGTAKEIVERYTHCALCGSNLHFIHVTDFVRNVTQETARCPECGVRARKLTHKLQ